MRKPLHFTLPLGLAIAVSVAVVVSGCGSTKTASTTASASAPSGATPQTTAQGSSQSPGPTGATTGHGGAQPTSNANRPTTAEAKSKRQQHAAEEHAAEKQVAEEHAAEKQAGERRVAKAVAQARARSKAAKKAFIEAEERRLRKIKTYPENFQVTFIARCQAAKGSASLCTCVLHKQEFSKEEKGQSLSELLALELVLRKGATIPEVAQSPVPRAAPSIPVEIRLRLEKCQGGK